MSDNPFDVFGQGIEDSLGEGVANVLAAVGDAANLLGLTNGYKNQNIVGSIVALTKGEGDPDTFYFTDFELPSDLDFGREQMANVHKLLGGKKTVDLYGTQADPIEVRGKLFNLPYQPEIIKKWADSKPRHDPGELAVMRAKRLAQICSQGNQIHFIYHKLDFNAVVVGVKFQAQHWNEIHFTLKLEILNDNIDALKLSGRNSTGATSLIPSTFAELLREVIEGAQAVQEFMQTASHSLAVANALITQLKVNPASLVLSGVRMIPGAAIIEQTVKTTQKAIDSLKALTDTVFPQTALDHANAQPYNTMATQGVTYLKDDHAEMRQRILDWNAFALSLYPNIEPYDSKSSFQQDVAMLYAALRLNRARYAYGRADKHLNKLLLPKRARERYHAFDPNLLIVSLEKYGVVDYWQDIARASNLDPRQPQYTGLQLLVIPYMEDVAASRPTLTPATSETA